MDSKYEEQNLETFVYILYTQSFKTGVQYYLLSRAMNRNNED